MNCSAVDRSRRWKRKYSMNAIPVIGSGRICETDTLKSFAEIHHHASAVSSQRSREQTEVEQSRSAADGFPCETFKSKEEPERRQSRSTNAIKSYNQTLISGKSYLTCLLEWNGCGRNIAKRAGKTSKQCQSDYYTDGKSRRWMINEQVS